MRRAAKVDDAQEVIVRALRAVGATVQSLAQIGAGCPDLLVGYRRQSFLLEVKSPEQVPSKRRLTAHEARWHVIWRGLPVCVVETPDAALRAIGALPGPSHSADGSD